MKKIAMFMAAAMMLVGTATFANNTVKAAKATKANQEAPKSTEKSAQKGHKKHHHKKAANATKPAATPAK
jgi:hypothetical protein